MRTRNTSLAITLSLLLTPVLAVAQTTVEQTIQISPGGGGGGSIQLPGMMGGPGGGFVSGVAMFETDK